MVSTQMITTAQAAALFGPQYQSPGLTNPRGLRRWTAALPTALYQLRHVMCLGASITLGVGSDGSSASAVPAQGHGSPVYDVASWAALLKTRLQASYGDGGDVWAMWDYRWTTSDATPTINTHLGVSQYGLQLTSASHTVTGTAPAGTVEADIWCYGGTQGTIGTSVNGAAVVAQTVANTSLPVKVTVTVAGGQTLQILGTAGGNNYVNFVAWRKQVAASTKGVLLSRFGWAGADSGRLTGVSASWNGASLMAALSSANTTALIAATLAANPDLLIIEMGVNDASNQGNSGITPTQFIANLTPLVAQQTANGGCTLLLNGPYLTSTPAPFNQDAYTAAAKAFAASTDHVAALTISDVWGSNAQGQADGLQLAGSIHPSAVGHGSYYRLVDRAIQAVVGASAPAM